MISGSLEEISGEEGKRLQDKMLETAWKYGIRFLGPNCLDVFSNDMSLNTTPIGNAPGGRDIAFVSQSGAYTCQSYDLWSNIGATINQTISVGNEADIDLVDCLEYLEGEGDVKAVPVCGDHPAP
ncbi:MAG: hypothetical protein SWK76_06220 [Actinomycetota bacterium]|nr:hypothetical protein [Actinomycetota bacterium]